MASLSDIISDIFAGIGSSRLDRNYRINNSHTTPTKYLEIPINTDRFELPVLAWDTFWSNQNNTCYDSFVAQMYSCGNQSIFKTLDSIMKSVLSTSFSCHLSKIVVPKSSKIYYGTFGAIFDSALKPLMMMSWIMERRYNSNGGIEYCPVKPVLHLDPQPFIEGADPMHKFITGKLLSSCMEAAIHANYAHYDSYSLRVEIDKCPFILRDINTPSISLSNESLLKLAADHIDEILQ